MKHVIDDLLDLEIDSHICFTCTHYHKDYDGKEYCLLYDPNTPGNITRHTRCRDWEIIDDGAF